MPRRSRTHKREITVPLASMGDIAFLLIIFFILAAQFIKADEKLTLPSAEELAKLEERPHSVVIDEESKIHFNGEEMSSADMLESRLVDAIGDAETPEGRTVFFKCHNEVTKKVFEPVLDRIAKANGILAVVGTEAGEERNSRPVDRDTRNPRGRPGDN